MTRYFIYLVLLFASFIGLPWVFNHVNVWAGIALALILVFLFITQISKQSKA